MRESAGGIILGPTGKMVLVEQHANSWSFPKGGIEEGETALEAAYREIREETGLTTLEFVEELGTYTRYSLDLEGKGENKELGLRPRTFFLFTTTEEALRPADAEVTKAEWVTVEEAMRRLTHPKDKEFLALVAPRFHDRLQ